MSERIHYVMGLMFSPDKKFVVLIKKTKPQWQAGKLNGVGGKIEDSDLSPFHAMVREFEEETGVKTTIFDWEKFVTMESPRMTCTCFWSFHEAYLEVQTTTEEEVQIVSIHDIFCGHHPVETVPNLKWQIQLALDQENKQVHVYYP